MRLITETKYCNSLFCMLCLEQPILAKSKCIIPALSHYMDMFKKCFPGWLFHNCPFFSNLQCRSLSFIATHSCWPCLLFPWRKWISRGLPVLLQCLPVYTDVPGCEPCFLITLSVTKAGPSTANICSRSQILHPYSMCCSVYTYLCVWVFAFKCIDKLPTWKEVMKLKKIFL